MSWYKGVRVGCFFFGGGLYFKGSFSSQKGCSGASGCAQGPGAGQPGLACINRLRLLAIRAAVAGPGGERNAFVSPALLAAGRDRWKAKRALNKPRPSIVIKASPRNQSCYLPARMTGETLPLIAAKPGSEPTRGLSALGTAVDVGQGCRRAPSPRWFNLQVTHLQHRRVATAWRETSGCQRSIATSSPLFSSQDIGCRVTFSREESRGFRQRFPAEEARACPLACCLVTPRGGAMRRARGCG